MNIIYAPRFIRAYKNLPANIMKKAELTEDIFKANPFDVRLKTHKLSGKLNGYWSFSIDNRYRIIFRFYKETVYFLAIGGHEIYK